MNMKKSWSTTRDLATQNDINVFFKFNHKPMEYTDPKQIRISKSVIKISNNISILEQSILRLDKLIKDKIV